MKAASLPDEAVSEVKFEESASVPKTLPPLTLKIQPGNNRGNSWRTKWAELGDSNDALGTVIGVALAASELRIRAIAIGNSMINRRDKYDEGEDSFMPKMSA